MSTRTHTHFWSEDDLTGLCKEADKLRLDYRNRIENNSHVPADLRLSAKDRIDNLYIAIRLMADKAD